MKLTDKENFEICCVSPDCIGKCANLEECLNLKILGIVPEEKGDKAKIELENERKLFIEAKNEIAIQCLGKIIMVIQRDYIVKILKDSIDRDFCLAGRMS